MRMPFSKERNEKQANMVDDEPMIATMTEANSVGIDSGWWLDTGATIHICKDHSLYKTYEKN